MKGIGIKSEKGTASRTEAGEMNGSQFGLTEKTGRRTRPRGKRSEKHSSEYVRLDTQKCLACWDCLAACKFGVLGKVNLWFHKHAVFKRRENCKGCYRCVNACKNGALTPIGIGRAVEGQGV